MDNPLLRQDNESLKEFKIRLCKNKDLYNLSWRQIADILNKETGDSWGESKYRKWFKAYQEGYEDGLHEKLTGNEVLNEIEEKQVQLQKERYKFQDQKREYNNLLRKYARFEHLKEEVHKAIKELEKVKPIQFNQYLSTNPVVSKSGIILFSDWHYGMDFKNTVNEYNPNILRDRVKKLVAKTIRYIDLHEINNLTIAILGDMISGQIHTGTRVQSSEDVISQIKMVSEILSETIAELYKYVGKMKVVNVVGNHARTIPDKTDAILKENFEYLIPWYLEARLEKFNGIEIVYDHDGYYIDDVFGEKFVYVHGDLDQINSIAKSLPQILGVVPKYVFLGHVHHNYVNEFGKTTVYVSGSLMGTDDYALSKRYFSSPSQKFLVLDYNDVECVYDIRL